MEKKKILEDLMYDEDLEFERVVPKVKKLVLIKKSGEPVIVSDNEKFSQKEIIAVYLVGKYFANQLELTEDNSATIKEIAGGLRLKESVVGARIKELRDEGIIERVSKGKHRISTVRLEKFLDGLLNKLNPSKPVEGSR
jgi:translation elongation factor P/translation initiation factor 5A